MLGRLKMSIDECINAYLTLSDRIFRKKRHRVTVKGNIQGRFDSDELVRAEPPHEPCDRRVAGDRGDASADGERGNGIGAELAQRRADLEDASAGDRGDRQQKREARPGGGGGNGRRRCPGRPG